MAWFRKDRKPDDYSSHQSDVLIQQTSDLRDQLLESVTKLDAYAMALQAEVERLKVAKEEL